MEIMSIGIAPIIGLLILASGLVYIGMKIGYKMGCKDRKVIEAQAPDYDMNNPINARGEVRTVVECGREWTVYGGNDVRLQ